MGHNTEKKSCHGVYVNRGMGKNKSLGEKIKKLKSRDKANSDESCGQWCLDRLEMQIS